MHAAVIACLTALIAITLLAQPTVCSTPLEGRCCFPLLLSVLLLYCSFKVKLQTEAPNEQRQFDYSVN